MTEKNMKNLYDVIVVGGGPAGLTAAIYLARARYRVLVIEKEQFGGQITITSEVVNYPGAKKTSGKALTETMRKQAESFGAEFLLAEVEQLDLQQDIKTVHTSRGELSCFGLLIATGAHPRMIGFTGEAEFRGHGVAYCATCDGEFFTGKDVFVVGGGFAAAEESVFLTKYAKHVTILIREDDFTCAKATAEAAKNHEKISILTNTVVESVAGDTALRSLRYRNTITGEITEYQAPVNDTFGVFVFAGYEPATQLVKNIVQLNPQGYVITDQNQQTNLPGVYAAGDVCVKNLRQVVTAVGDGALAATELEKYAANMQRKTGLQPIQPNNKILSEEEKPAQEKNVDDVLSEEIRAQLITAFAKMEQPLLLKLYLDGQPIAKELQDYMTRLTKMTSKLSMEIGKEREAQQKTPYVQICRQDGTATGLAFHGVPGGHEFTSFILGLYNVAGPGQTLDSETQERIQKISKPIQMKILVSLSCTMCPELVTAAQKIAASNPLVTAEVYDLNHFPDLKEHYQVMSVPCLVINEKQVFFGKKNIKQLLDIILEK